MLGEWLVGGGLGGAGHDDLLGAHERLRAVEYAPLQEDLERHLFFLDRQLGRLHELLLYLVQVVLPR